MLSLLEVFGVYLYKFVIGIAKLVLPKQSLFMEAVVNVGVISGYGAGGYSSTSPSTVASFTVSPPVTPQGDDALGSSSAPYYPGFPF